jgi:hypothetical protein
MRWSTRSEPRRPGAPPTAAEPSRQSRAECADWVVLARRMSIPDDHAIRQFVDLAMGANAEEHHQPDS